MHAGSLILSSSHAIGVTGGSMETRVTLRPGDKGTKRMVEQFGERLICVRYRYDVARKMRYKTVELVIEAAPWDPARPETDRKPGRPPALVGLRIRYEEEKLRQTVKAAGGRWDRERKVWIVPLRIARRLGLEARVVAVPDSAGDPGAMTPQ
jgi:hypothetical protein